MKDRGQKVWHAPVLTVLTKGGAEEAVLNACKIRGGLGGPQGGEWDCMESEFYCGGICNRNAPS